mmetsp:Transcript_4068/g.8443  ORF Transcript_4068/g.8443 Transcript_4068/m.8443 type:complete len:180 (-) Transcript_4068:219-758(-)
MLRHLPTVARRATLATATRPMSTVGTAFTAGDAADLSGYKKIDFSINEDATVLEAVKTFVAHNIGCLVTTNSKGDLTGIISERDYIAKVDLLDRDPSSTKVKEIFTPSSKLVTANTDESVQGCMEKMLASDIRHLPLVDHGELVGMISVKDLVKTCIKEQEQTIKVLSDFALGKSSYSC